MTSAARPSLMQCIANQPEGAFWRAQHWREAATTIADQRDKLMIAAQALVDLYDEGLSLPRDHSQLSAHIDALREAVAEATAPPAE